MISCRGVRFSYDGRTPALDGIDLDIADGEFLCVLGGNGSGKSTLAQHLNALLVPQEGTVTVDGLDTADPEYVYDIRSRVGLVFQNPDDQLVATLVEDDVAFGPENLGVPSAEIAEAVADSLAAVGLTGFEQREAHALSGGQKQRVAIAGVLAMHPKVLVLDEASAMLDPRGRRGLMRVVHDLHGRGMTIVMITHFMEEAALADRVVVMDAGRIALSGTPQEVLTHEDVLHRLDLEVPVSCQVGAALARRGWDVVPQVDEGRMCADIARALGRAGEVSSVAGDEISASSRGVAPHDAAKAAPATVPCGGNGELATTTAAVRGAARSVTMGAARAMADAVPTCEQVPSAETDAGLVIDHVWYTDEPSARERERHTRRRAGRRARAAKWGGDPDDVWALEDVGLEVRAGEFLGIAGHTGSGKSTLIQHMNGLAHPTRGRVLLFGEDLADKRVSAAAKPRVGVVFQYPEHQLFAQTVYEDVAFGPRNLGLAETEVDSRVREALERVGLSFDEVAHKSPFALSGGQQRRAAFAGVLAMRPEILVLDEPAAGLDPAARRSFLAFVASLRHEGLTVVMVSHSMDDLAQLADRVAVMNEGRVSMVGTPREVFARADELERVGLGVPAAQRMARDLIARGAPLDSQALFDAESLVRALDACAAAGEGR